MTNQRYRLECLQGKHPSHDWGFVSVKKIAELSEEENSTGISVLNDWSVLLLRAGINGGARALIYGLLIGANISSPQDSYKKSLNLLYAAALELRDHYSNGWIQLRSQSQMFPASGNAVIKLLEGVLSKKISTAELVYLANKDCDSDYASGLTMALIDLLHYILYKQAVKVYKINDSLGYEKKAIEALMGPKASMKMRLTDLLGVQFYLSNIHRNLICSYLHFSYERWSIQKNGDCLKNQEGYLDKNILFSTVVINKKTYLLLDERIVLAIDQDFQNRAHQAYKTHLYDLELFYQSTAIDYVPQLSMEDQLQELRSQFIQSCYDATECIDQSIFLEKLSVLRRLFFDQLRPKCWLLEKRDILFELEQLCCQWQHMLDSLSNKSKDVVMNLIEIRNILNEMYEGSVPVLCDGPQVVPIMFYLGGVENYTDHIHIDWGEVQLSAQHSQVVQILLHGINQTMITVESHDVKFHLCALKEYLIRLQALVSLNVHKKKNMKEILNLFKQKQLAKVNPESLIFGELNIVLNSLEETIKLPISTKKVTFRVPEKKLYQKAWDSLMLQFQNLLHLLSVPQDTSEKKNYITQCNAAWFHIKQAIKTMLNTYPNEKNNILSDLVEYINQRINTISSQNNLDHPYHPLVKANMRCIKKYFEYLADRQNFPIPNALKQQWLSLKEHWKNDINKSAFIIALEKEIQEHPEKLYRECVCTVRENAPPSVQLLFSQRRNIEHSFFGLRHKTHKLIEQLLLFDPDPEIEWFHDEIEQCGFGCY